MKDKLLQEMYSAVQKCLNVAETISSIDDIKDSMSYDVLLYNLIVIRDIEKKLPQETKVLLNEIEWDKFKTYDDQITDKTEYRDKEVIEAILKNELPLLKKVLEKIISE